MKKAGKSRGTTGGGRRRAPDPEKRPGKQRLRLRTYLTPSVPRSLFAYLADYLGERLGMATELQIETHHSGPPRGLPDPFTEGALDIGFFCAPPYIWLQERPEPPVELVPSGSCSRIPATAPAGPCTSPTSLCGRTTPRARSPIS
jgi:hypothetical protein